MMKWVSLAIAGLALAGCATFPRDTTVAEYCANPDRTNEAVCQLQVDVAGTRASLSETNLSLTEARRVADAASASASRAQQTADEANRKADAALARADQALNSGDLYCQTQTIQKTDTGSCPAGFKLMSCTQTRYTTRAGGLSFLREINDEKCRFNSRVLEMQVRCCALSSTVAQPQASYPASGTDTASTTTIRRTYTVSAQ